MTKNPRIESGTPDQISKRQRQILDMTNRMIQGMIMAVLDCATSDCKCATCQSVKKMIPIVRFMLDAGKGKVIPKA